MKSTRNTRRPTDTSRQSIRVPGLAKRDERPELRNRPAKIRGAEIIAGKNESHLQCLGELMLWYVITHALERPAAWLLSSEFWVTKTYGLLLTNLWGLSCRRGQCLDKTSWNLQDCWRWDSDCCEENMQWQCLRLGEISLYLLLVWWIPINKQH